jgi:hypothetical protein
MIDFQKPGMGTTVNWYDGASIVNFIRPGVAVYQDAIFNMYGGRVDYILYTFNNSLANIYGGQINHFLDAGNDSIVNIHNGVINGDLFAVNRANVSMHDGYITQNLRVWEDAHCLLSGGIVYGAIVVGYFMDDKATLTIKGQDFNINGQTVGAGVYYANDFATGTITGILSNGDCLNNNFEIVGDSCIVLVPEPTTLSLLALGAVLLRRKRRT